MILKRKLFAKPTMDIPGLGKEGIYFRDSHLWKNHPRAEEEEKAILQLLKDLDFRGYLNQHGKDYLNTADHRDEVHISSYMLTDEGEDIMERYNGMGVSLHDIDKNGLAKGFKKKPRNLKEDYEYRQKEQERERKKWEKESKEAEDRREYIKNRPEIKNLFPIINELSSNYEYQSLDYIDDIPLPIFNYYSIGEKYGQYLGAFSIGELNILYDTKTDKFVEIVDWNYGKNIKTKPISNLKQRIVSYLNQNKNKLLKNACDGLEAYDGKKSSEKEKKAISSLIDSEIKLIQSKL